MQAGRGQRDPNPGDMQRVREAGDRAGNQEDVAKE